MSSLGSLVNVMFLEQQLFRSVIENTPLISIDLIIENEKGEFLLGKRINRPAQGYWFVPGGRIVKNETMSKAFTRLTLGELGVAFPFSSAEFLGVFEHFYSDSAPCENISTHYIAMAYKIKVNQSELKLPDTQHSDYRWLTHSALLHDASVHRHTQWYFE